MKKWEEKKEEKNESLLQELCKDDANLYSFLNNYLLLNPVAGISKKDLDILTEEAEKSGNFESAVDKAIFEATENLEEMERNISIIQKIASKAMHMAEQKKRNIEKEGLTELDASLSKRIKNMKFLIERTEDIISTASIFYKEIFLTRDEKTRKEARKNERRAAERQEREIEELEIEERKKRKNKIRGMDRIEKRAAKEQYKRDDLAAEERKNERGEEIKKTEREEIIIGESEAAERKARKNERR